MFKPNVFGCLPSSGLMMANRRKMMANSRWQTADGKPPDDGKQPKTFGLNILILQFLTF